MSWLLAAYGAVVAAVILYAVRIARMRRAVRAEIEAATRGR